VEVAVIKAVAEIQIAPVAAEEAVEAEINLIAFHR
jgi:hypothetical protein